MIICIVKCLLAKPVSFFFVVFVFVFLLEKEFDLYYVIYIQLSDFLGCDISLEHCHRTSVIQTNKYSQTCPSDHLY
jgi:hypothetical protein